MLDQAFDALKSFNWGSDLNPLKPIDEAVIASTVKAEERAALESRLAAVLKTDASPAAKDYVFRKLQVVGTAASVGALAAFLPDKDLSHKARIALERIPAPEAAQALRDAIPQLSPELQVGAISSLGVRKDTDSIPALAKLLAAADVAVACAAAYALGDIRNTEAAAALAGGSAKPETRKATTDASLSCAEGLLATGKKGEALAIYKKFAGEDQPKHVRLAATRGMLACAGKAS